MEARGDYRDCGRRRRVGGVRERGGGGGGDRVGTLTLSGGVVGGSLRRGEWGAPREGTGCRGMGDAGRKAGEGEGEHRNHSLPQPTPLPPSLLAGRLVGNKLLRQTELRSAMDLFQVVPGGHLTHQTQWALVGMGFHFSAEKKRCVALLVEKGVVVVALAYWVLSYWVLPWCWRWMDQWWEWWGSVRGGGRGILVPPHLFQPPPPPPHLEPLAGLHQQLHAVAAR